MDIQTIMLAIRIAQMIKQAREKSAPQSEDMSGGFTEQEKALIEDMMEGVPDGARNIMIELIYNMLKSYNPDYHFPDLDSDEQPRLRTDDDPPAPKNWWDYDQSPPPQDDDDDGNPFKKAWAFLKAEEPPEYHGDDDDDDEPLYVSDDQLPNLRIPTPIDWLDPFRMTRPHMSLALNHIHEELERRGGFGQSPSSPPNPDNPFVRHTRNEMRQAMQMMSDELERRGRPPLSDEHFAVFSGGQRPDHLPMIANDEEVEQYQRLRRLHDHLRNRRPRPRTEYTPSPEQIRVRNMGDHLDESTFDRDELMSRLMSGDILTEKELKFLQEGSE